MADDVQCRLQALYDIEGMPAIAREFKELENQNHALRQKLQPVTRYRFSFLNLTKSEIQIVSTLVSTQHVVTHDQLYTALYANRINAGPQQETVKVLVWLLRKKLEPYGVKIIKHFEIGWEIPPSDKNKLIDLENAYLATTKINLDSIAVDTRIRVNNIAFLKLNAAQESIFLKLYEKSIARFETLNPKYYLNRKGQRYRSYPIIYDLRKKLRPFEVAIRLREGVGYYMTDEGKRRCEKLNAQALS